MLHTKERTVVLPLLVLLALVGVVAAQNYWTTIREPNRCAWYGECGTSKDPGIPGNLNCPNNNVSQPFASENFRQQLVEYCGPEWDLFDSTCCDEDMFDSLVTSMKVAEQLVAQCPACWDNFKSMFINVSKIEVDSDTDKYVVTEAHYFVDKVFGEAFYDSCAEVTFSMSNQPAMLLIGGGATNYQEFFEFMGHKQFQGSPFDILFPPYETFPILNITQPMNATGYHCYDQGHECQCIDCAAKCGVLEAPPEEEELCYVGVLRCLPFSLILIFGVLLAVAGIVAFIRHRKGKDGADEEYMPINSQSPIQVATAGGSEWKLYTLMQRYYYRLGFSVASHPCIVLLLSILIVEQLALGLINFTIITDPIELWSDPQSATRLQKNYFDETFGPFYRTQQMILSPLDQSDNVVHKEYLQLLFEIEAGIAKLNYEVDGRNYNLETTCFKPIGELNDEGTLGGCVVYSVTGYWQYNEAAFDDPVLNPLGWEEHYRVCTSNPSFTGDQESKIGCLPPFQEPIKPEIALGGYDNNNYMDAKALVVTWVTNNSLDEEYLDGVFGWEILVAEYLGNVSQLYSETLRITYFTESGIELELARESTSDIVTVTISYIVMLLYVSIALGRFSSIRRFFIDTKFSLGIAGVLICIASVLASVGLFSMFGVGTSLIIAEVIPFLVLAVGVDNIFILVNEFERLDKTLSVEERAALTMSEVGPSITLSAVSETVAFSLGSVVTMPAVNSFAGYSAMAILIDFLLQITAFLALLAVDARRAEAQRLDCVPCVPLRGVEPAPAEQSDGLLKYFVRHFYTHFLLHPITKVVVLVSFAGLFIFMVSSAPYIELGLDQTIALPQDSYLIPYFADQMSLLKVGVPLYFVITGGNASEFNTKKSLCAAYMNCSLYSVPNVLVLESKRPEYSTVALRPAIWMDDYIAWTNPANLNCCRTRRANSSDFCQPTDPFLQCTLCYSQNEYAQFDLGPEGTDFMTKLNFWLHSIPSSECVRAGAAAYGTAVAPDYSLVTVNASHYRTYHTVIQTQEQYINAYQQALRICDSIEAYNADAGLKCFPYTIFYVYFEQYETIVGTMVLVLSMAALAVFLVTWLVLGSFVAALWVLAVVLMIVIDLAGVMALWKISLNAVSLVNMVMALGISVEFCSHITRAFTITPGERQDRARKALIDIGASVFSGVTMTKFAGVVVLAFAQSQIFVIYYFRMYLSIVLLGFGHGLILLPVLLSLWGPKAIRVNPVDTMAMAGDNKPDEIEQQRKSIYS